jgi:hypothetical protein
MLPRKLIDPSSPESKLNVGLINRALQAAAVELERQRASDSLKKGLEKRPQREDLVERACTHYSF